MDPNQIPFLIQLLDDEDASIRELVMKELATFGLLLSEELKRLSLPMNELQKGCIAEVLKGQKRIWLKQVWMTWFYLKTDLERLEGGLNILAQFLNIEESGHYLKDQLDELAESYRRRYQGMDAKQLANFLFKELKFVGNEEDYDNPQNSNLLYVIRERKGIPLSLASLYILVGARLGLLIEGCNFPGHFLARIELNGRKVLIDCFNGGQILEEKDIIRVHDETTKSLEFVLNERTDSYTIVRRFLANLIKAFQLQENSADSQLMIDLFKDLEYRIIHERFDDVKPEDIILGKTPLFQSGQIVIHQRYGYRGIVVGSDQRCKASDRWYYSNQTQPEREQPWYHILVNGSDQVTYVAESSLREDNLGGKISHPLLSYFFLEYEKGKYIRNQNPWPETDF